MTTVKRNQRSTAFTRGKLIKHHIRVVTMMVEVCCINRALSFSEPKCFTSYLFFFSFKMFCGEESCVRKDL